MFISEFNSPGSHDFSVNDFSVNSQHIFMKYCKQYYIKNPKVPSSTHYTKSILDPKCLYMSNGLTLVI